MLVALLDGVVVAMELFVCAVEVIIVPLPDADAPAGGTVEEELERKTVTVSVVDPTYTVVVVSPDDVDELGVIVGPMKGEMDEDTEVGAACVQKFVGKLLNAEKNPEEDMLDMVASVCEPEFQKLGLNEATFAVERSFESSTVIVE